MSFITRTSLYTAGIGLALAVTAPVLAKDGPHDGASERPTCGTAVPGWRMPALKNPSDASAVEIGCAVAAWQLAAKEDMSYIDLKVLESSYGRGWVKAAFYIGLDRFAAKMGDPSLLVRVRQYSLENGLELGDRPWHGDDQAVAAVYAAVALRDGEPDLIKKSVEHFDYIIAQNYTNSLEFNEPADPGKEGDCQKRWCWADAIFMAPPAWALASQVTGDPRYVNYAASETRAIIEYLQDPKTGLLFRDSRYFEQRTPNGKPVFWSRGNGWVFAGLARFIEAMPADHPDRPLMVKTYQRMAGKLVSIQREDGYWPTSLMDAAYVTNPETSGTAFFGFGLAWGLNNGMLEGAQYEAARDKAWDAIRRAVTTSGKVGWVQQIGKDPQSTTAETSQLYAAGGTLLFATEMLSREMQE